MSTAASNAASRPPAGTRAVTSAGIRKPSLRSRLVGLGSVFGKSFRDSRRSAIAVGALFALVFVVTAAQVAEQFDTAASRLALAAQLQSLPPIFQGMLGEPIAIERLGGFLSWRILNILPVMLGIWSVIALSGTLAGELGRGSMDMLAASPIPRPSLALQKLAGYLVALALAIALIALAMIVSFGAFAELPGDEVGLEAIVAHSVWLYVLTLAPGAVAFALAPAMGRSAALGIGAVVLFASFLVDGFAGSIAAFETLEPVSYFSVTAGHRPVAGTYDWPALGLVAAATAGLLVAGLLAFGRRDLLVPSGGRFRIPSIRLWIQEPFTRALGERIPAAIAWGLALGLFGLIVASSADQFVETLRSIPQIVAMIRQIFPDEDILSTGGLLQLSFFAQAILIVGLAAGGFVGGWASDEGERRLELVLSAPVSRGRWALRSASAVMVAIALMTAIMAIGAAIGAATQAGDDIAGPVSGLAVLGLYGMALAGVGLAVGGLVRPGLAAPVTIVLGIAFYMLDLLGSILDLPDEVVDLALNRHLGRPVLGTYDWPGMAVCAALAIGGVVLCAVGMRRRDIGR